MASSTLHDPFSDPPDLGRDRVSDGVTAYLRDLILSGQLPPGAPLRVEHLAGHLQISVTPIRESLVELLGEGFVARAPRRGYTVAEISRTDMDDLFHVHALLAGELAARTARAISEPELAALDEAQARIDAAAQADDRETMERVNEEFHRRINEAARSPKFEWFVHRTTHYAPRGMWRMLDGWMEATTTGHREILRALHEHEPETARDLMLDHIRESGKRLTDHLHAQGFWDRKSS